MRLKQAIVAVRNIRAEMNIAPQTVETVAAVVVKKSARRVNDNRSFPANPGVWKVSRCQPMTKVRFPGDQNHRDFAPNC